MKYLIPAAALLAAGALFTHAASAAPPEKYSSSFKGDGASVWLSDYEPGVSPTPDISCGTITDVYISASSNVVHNQPGKPNASTEIFANLYSYDTCTGYTQFSGYGFVSNAGFVSNGTNSASLTATIDIFDWYSGSTAPLSVSLTLNGTGDISHATYHSKERWGNTTFQSRSNGSYREALVSGDVVWRGDDLMDTASSGASLSKVASGFRYITRY